VELSSNLLGQSRSAGYESLANLIQNHLIVIDRGTPLVDVGLSDPSKDLPQQEIENNEKGGDKKKPIHCGLLILCHNPM
jgi:hypothetical protein